MSRNNWCKKKYFKRKNIWQVRLRVSAVGTLLQIKIVRYSMKNLIRTLFILNRIQNTKRSNNDHQCKHDLLKNSFFPCTISQWIKLNSNISISASLGIFKENLLDFIRPNVNSIFDIHNPCGFKLLTRLRLDLSHLYELKFSHCFQDNLPVANFVNYTLSSPLH